MMTNLGYNPSFIQFILDDKRDYSSRSLIKLRQYGHGAYSLQALDLK